MFLFIETIGESKENESKENETFHFTCFRYFSICISYFYFVMA